MTPADHAATVLTSEERFELRAKYRRIKLRHDDAFYGPMKGTTCGCDYCQPIRDMLRVLDDADALAERATELEREVAEMLSPNYRSAYDAERDRATELERRLADSEAIARHQATEIDAAEARAEQLERRLRKHLDAIQGCAENTHMDDRERLLMVVAAVADARAALDGGTAT